jgi:hypothetical protein
MGRMTYNSMATDFDFEEPTDYEVPISTVMRLLKESELWSEINQKFRIPLNFHETLEK